QPVLPPPTVPPIETPPPARAQPPAVPANESKHPAESDDDAVIRSVVASYARAIESKDLALFRSLKPNMGADEERRIQQGFRAVTSQKVNITILSIDRRGDRATVQLQRQDVIEAGGRRQAPPTSWIRPPASSTAAPPASDRFWPSALKPSVRAAPRSVSPCSASPSIPSRISIWPACPRCLRTIMPRCSAAGRTSSRRS